jgi:hypothetical protein
VAWGFFSRFIAACIFVFSSQFPAHIPSQAFFATMPQLPITITRNTNTIDHSITIFSFNTAKLLLLFVYCKFAGRRPKTPFQPAKLQSTIKMVNRVMPIMLLPLDDILSRSNLSPQKAIDLIVAATKEHPKAVEATLYRWRKNKWPSFPVAHKYLNILGWDIVPTYVADRDIRVRTLKGNFRYWLGEMSEAKQIMRPVLKGKMAKALEELREIYGARPLTDEQIDWWRERVHECPIEWWNDRYLEQLALAQNDPARSAHARYALGVIKALKVRRLSNAA